VSAPDEYPVSPRLSSLMLLGMNFHAIIEHSNRRLRRAKKVRIELGEHLLAVSAAAQAAFDAVQEETYDGDTFAAAIRSLESAYKSFDDAFTHAAKEAQRALAEEDAAIYGGDR
jgi:hypothetical protein